MAELTVRARSGAEGVGSKALENPHIASASSSLGAAWGGFGCVPRVCVSKFWCVCSSMGAAWGAFGCVVRVCGCPSPSGYAPASAPLVVFSGVFSGCIGWVCRCPSPGVWVSKSGCVCSSLGLPSGPTIVVR
jgi:hypothetical protein